MKQAEEKEKRGKGREKGKDRKKPLLAASC
jgi:hypothetical protein